MIGYVFYKMYINEYVLYHIQWRTYLCAPRTALTWKCAVYFVLRISRTVLRISRTVLRISRTVREKLLLGITKYNVFYEFLEGQLRYLQNKYRAWIGFWPIYAGTNVRINRCFTVYIYYTYIRNISSKFVVLTGWMYCLLHNPLMWSRINNPVIIFQKYNYRGSIV